MIDWTLSVSNILSYVGIVLVVGWRVSLRIQAFEHILAEHTRSLSEHGARMDRYEERLIELVGDLQRLVGRSEINQQRR